MSVVSSWLFGTTTMSPSRVRMVVARHLISRTWPMCGPTWTQSPIRTSPSKGSAIPAKTFAMVLCRAKPTTAVSTPPVATIETASMPLCDSMASTIPAARTYCVRSRTTAATGRRRSTTSNRSTAATPVAPRMRNRMARTVRTSAAPETPKPWSTPPTRRNASASSRKTAGAGVRARACGGSATRSQRRTRSATTTMAAPSRTGASCSSRPRT